MRQGPSTAHSSDPSGGPEGAAGASGSGSGSGLRPQAAGRTRLAAAIISIRRREGAGWMLSENPALSGCCIKISRRDVLTHAEAQDRD
jgi:hypothetical protein